MGFIIDIKHSIASYSEGWAFVKQHKLGRFVWISFFLYLCVFALSAFTLWFLVNYFLSSLFSLGFIKKYTAWLSQYSWILIITKIAVYIASSFLLISIFKFLFLIIASPLYAYISERSATLFHGQEYPFNVSQLIKDILRGIRISVRNFIKQMLFMIPLLLLSFIPVIGLFFSFILILFDSYYYGFSMIDYNCERHKISVRESSQLISNRKGLAIGNGLIIYLSFLIPIVGVVFIAPLSVIAATLTYYKYLHKK
jgi:CysZ protein